MANLIAKDGAAVMATTLLRRSCSIVGIHSIAEITGSNIWAIYRFRQFIDYIVANNIWAITISELYALTTSGITIPRPRAL